ncbi:hypothetical protein PMAYCL1PPCAC_18693 [Pristionchus mayeri]|uniref:Uncharacterized protein n=1 Tax=Pristionchus mayeri TaxID=1317129 RepID=A0AAN5CPY9_9BILA|nr:hypothetical protein PMAYCL1PPCAC_18693 [Pristionchus mayeri]
MSLQKHIAATSNFPCKIPSRDLPSSLTMVRQLLSSVFLLVAVMLLIDSSSAQPVEHYIRFRKDGRSEAAPFFNVHQRSIEKDENIQPFIRFRKADPHFTNPNIRFFADYEM